MQDIGAVILLGGIMKMLDVDTQTEERVKENINVNIGNNITIRRFNRQGRKIEEWTGEISSVYNDVFCIKQLINKYSINRSFSYADMTTNIYDYDITQATNE